MRGIVFAVVVVMVGLLAREASADPIDLGSGNFFADPTVTLGPGINDAMIEEDATFFLVFLSNDPGLGDPELLALVPGAGKVVTFTLDFDEPAGNDDEFGAFLIDPQTGLSYGGASEFFTTGPQTGLVVTLDLDVLVGGGFSSAGLQFQLSSLPGDSELTSKATITGVDAGVPVPEPAAGLLLALGAGALYLRLRRKANRT